MILEISMLIAGVVVFAMTAYLFWLLGQEGRISPRWRNATAMEAVWVFIILSGWAAGVSLVIKSLVDMAGG
jgi:hypothetical protein